MSEAAVKRRVVPLKEDAGGDWPDPDMRLVSDGRGQPPPFPVDALRSMSGWVQRQAEQRSCAPDYVAMSLITCAAAAIGNSREGHVWADFYVPSALWAVLMGPPSTKKTPALRPALDAFREAEAELGADYEAGMARYEADKIRAAAMRDAWEETVREMAKKGQPVPDKPSDAMDPARPTCPRLFVSDTTTEALVEIVSGNPRGVLLYRDELAGFIGGMDRYSRGTGDKQFYIEAYNAGPFKKDRKSDAPIYIPRLNVSVLGTVQPDKFSEMMLSGADDGFTARFLPVWPDPVPPKRPGRYVHDETALGMLRALVALDMPVNEKGAPRPHAVPFSEGAQDGFERFMQENFRKTNEAHGLMASFRGKLDGLVCRLALVLEFMEWAFNPSSPEPSEISRESFGLAALLVEAYCVPMAGQAYTHAGVTTVERRAMFIAKRIKRDGLRVVNRRDVLRDWYVPGVHRDAEKVREAFDSLEALGWVRQRGSDGPGRKAVDYDVNPKVHHA